MRASSTDWPAGRRRIARRQVESGDDAVDLRHQRRLTGARGDLRGQRDLPLAVQALDRRRPGALLDANELGDRHGARAWTSRPSSSAALRLDRKRSAARSVTSYWLLPTLNVVTFSPPIRMFSACAMSCTRTPRSAARWRSISTRKLGLADDERGVRVHRVRQRADFREDRVGALGELDQIGSGDRILHAAPPPPPPGAARRLHAGLQLVRDSCVSSSRARTISVLLGRLALVSRHQLDEDRSRVDAASLLPSPSGSWPCRAAADGRRACP